MTRLAESDIELESLSETGRELVLSSAVQERFRPSQLMADWLERQAPEEPTAGQLQEAVDVTLSLGAMTGGGS